MRVVGTVGEAQAALPIGQCVCKFAIVHADSSVQWEEGELRRLNVPAAALKVSHVAGLEVTCVWNDSGTVAMRTRVSKTRLTEELMATTKRLKELRAQQDKLNSRLSEVEGHLVQRERRVQRETATVMSLQVQKLREALRKIDATKAAAPLPVPHNGVARPTKAGPADHSAQAAASSTGDHAPPGILQSALASAPRLQAPAKPSAPSHRSVGAAVQRAIRGVKALAVELHPRLRREKKLAAAAAAAGSVDAAAGHTGPEKADIVQTWLASPVHLHVDKAAHEPPQAPEHDVAAAAPSPVGELGTDDGPSGAASEPSPRRGLALMARRAAFPALVLTWCASQQAVVAQAAVGAVMTAALLMSQKARAE